MANGVLKNYAGGIQILPILRGGTQILLIFGEAHPDFTHKKNKFPFENEWAQ